MDIFNSIDEASDTLLHDSSTYVCIGNFDGCHLGHQKLISNIVQSAQNQQIRTSILTFDPSPKIFFNPNQAKRNLFSHAQKLEAFKELGVDCVIVQSFTKDFSRLNPAEFVDYLLKLNCSKVFVGSNFRFGANRKGTIEYLRTFNELFEVVALSIETVNKKVVSSTRVRELIDKGQMKDASALLGRPYCLSGKIVKGLQVGRTISFPTANLEAEEMLPKKGVYCGYISLGKSKTLKPNLRNAHKAIFNVGVRPTIASDGKTSIEGHALDMKWEEEELYGHQANFYLLEFLRPEIEFKDLENLKDQIIQDSIKARSILL